MPCEHWKEMRLDRINKKLSALRDALYNVSMGMENFIETNNKEFMDIIIYGQETVEGICELIGDIKDDISSLIEQIQEKEEPPKMDIPDKI